MQQKIEAFGPPMYTPLERRFGRTFEDAPQRMIRRVDNQKVTGFKGPEVSKQRQQGQGS